MTKEERRLLLKDLCARLSYGVIVSVPIVGGSENKKLVSIINEDDGIPCVSVYSCEVRNSKGKLVSYEKSTYLLCDIKPYLRPMSSMTDEERKDILQSLNIHGDIDNEGNLLLGVECDIITLKVCKKYLGELNKRMFDVCHMIEKGIALEAPEGMYKTE